MSIRGLLTATLLVSLALGAGVTMWILLLKGKIPDGSQLWAAVAMAAAFLGTIGGGAGLLTITNRDVRARQDADYQREVAAVRERTGADGGMAAADASWELARVKLESYLNRNLDQVRAIFWLSVVLMTAGFCLIMFGVWLMLQGRTDASMVGAGSGVLVEFIGASLLKLYQSIMGQARRYVQVLERINAVGMAVRILDGIDGTEHELKQRALVDVSRSLLQMYTGLPEEADDPESRPAAGLADQIAAN